MPDARGDPDTGVTVELAVSDVSDVSDGAGAETLPAPRPDLRDQLPGLEPERQVSDWGRSERIEGIVDRTVYEFLYHYWFRVEVEGLENIPLRGGALILANHAGAVPSDAAMITKAIREEHPRRRNVHLATRNHLASVPALGTVARKLGAVADHPANLHRLLFDEGQLVLAFPEGTAGTRKPLKERYRLRRFEAHELLSAALRANVPIVPLAVLGAEEALPTFAALRGVSRIPYLRLTAPFPLPAKFKLRFLEPVEPDELDRAAWGHPANTRELGERIRELIADNLLELVASRRSVWLG